jgi:anthranilate synthase component II
MPELLRALLPTKPMLGICLGMQAMVEASGGRLYNQERLTHGVVAQCAPVQPVDGLLQGLGDTFEVGLYHSWAAESGSLPANMRITARSETGVVMAVRHLSYPACGVQFHPESVMTPMGSRILENWMRAPAG